MSPASAIREHLGAAAVLTDFDGTLAPIVDDPALAAPGPGAVQALHDLAGRAQVVGVVSGRPIDVLVQHLPDERLHLAGLYGLERRELGVVADSPEAARWVRPVALAGEELDQRAPEGVVVEVKRLSLTVHYRLRPELAMEVRALCEEVAGSHGLLVRPARKSVEVHPPETPDKGSVVEDLAAGCEAACFLGDDVGDLPAFDALDRLRAGGLATVKVAVDSPEAAKELIDSADVVVDGTDGAIAWLRSLL